MSPRPANRHVYSEHLPYEELTQQDVLSALASRNITLAFAVTERLADGAASVVRACRELGVSVAIWPLLEPSEGRWASGFHARRFVTFARALVADLADKRALPSELVLDLEPPYDLVAPPRFASLRALAARPREPDATEQFARLLADARALGLVTTLAAVPMVLADRDTRGFQTLLATPALSLSADRVAVMAYTSLAEGYSAGAIHRADARALLAVTARATEARLGARACLALGTVDRGCLGDERPYRDVAELTDDVAIARAAGVDDLGLFSLCGIMKRPPIEPWLDAFVTTAPAVALPSTPRARAIAAAATVLSRVLALVT